MSFRIAGFVAVALLLCGCSDADWDHLLSYDTHPDPSTVQTASADAPQSDIPSTSDSSMAAPPPSAVVTQTVAPPPSYTVTQTVAPPSSTVVTQPVAPPPSYVATQTVALQPVYAVTQTVVTTTPLLRADPTTGYCQNMAQRTGAQATRDGLDGPGQQEAADAIYKQCMTYYGGSGR